MTANEAEKITGLSARIIERPTDDTVDFKPSERLMSVGDALRCQLGVETEEHFLVRVKGELVNGWGKVFILKSYGPTFEVAVGRLTAIKLAAAKMSALNGDAKAASALVALTQCREVAQ